MAKPKREPRPDADIVADIVKACGDESIRPHALAQIDILRKLKDYAPYGGYRRENLPYLKKLKSRIEAVEKTLRTPPPGFSPVLLFGPAEAPTVDDAIRQSEARWEQVSAHLVWLRERCAHLIKVEIGEHRSSGYPQECAAMGATDLMKLCRKPLAWSSPTSAYRIVAGLLFEAVYGEQGRDLERACEVMSKRPIQTQNIWKGKLSV